MKDKLVLAILVLFTMMFVGCRESENHEQIKYQVSYEENGGSIVEGYNAFEGENVKLPSTTKEGYTFLGWYLDSDLTLTAKDKKVDSDIKLYAKWEINKYKVVVEGKEYEIEYGKHINPESPEKVGYTFLGWYLDSNYIRKWNNEVIKENITLYSRFEKNKYTVKFKNSNINDMEVEYNELISEPNAEKEGFTLDGWFIDSNYTEKWDFSKDKVTSNITLYAKYSVDKKIYIVTFYDYDRTILSTQEIDPNNKVVEPKEPKRDGFEFEGWYIDSNYSKKWNFESDNVTSNIGLYAKYTTDEKTYTVTFYDYDGKVLSTQEVLPNGNAVEPEEPERDGYRFEGWDIAFNNVTSNLSVKAKYIQEFVVKFLNYDNSIIDIQYIDINNNAVAPTAPTRINYRFKGWDKEFNNIKSDLVVKAEYIKQFKVEFIARDGTVLKDELIDEGGNATAPKVPSLEGYNFKGWDKEFNNIKSNMKVTATYEIKKYKVTFVMPDKTEKVQIVEYGFNAIEPKYSEYFVIEEENRIQFVEITGWDKEFNKIKSDLKVTANYNKCNTPAIIIDIDGKSATIYIYIGEYEYISGVEFTIDYKTNNSQISINKDKVNINEAGILNKCELSINNSVKKITCAWVSSEAKKLTYCSNAMTLVFDLDNTTVNSENLTVENCRFYVAKKIEDKPKEKKCLVIYK